MNSFKVKPENEGQTLDRFLAESLKSSRKKAKQLIDGGKVFLGERKIIIASWKLMPGETVEIRESGEGGLPRRQRYLRVHYEDPDLLVVEKPPGVACERSAQTLSSTLVDDINDYLKRAHPSIEYPYVGLMHRLDRETSGLMVYTLSKQANSLALQFKRHQIGRRYVALVEGNLVQNEGRIEKGLMKHLESGGKKMRAVEGMAKSQRAVTQYHVLERYGPVTLVEAQLETGRTHQVRAHFASLGHPVVGDKLYGSKMSAPRHMLHAAFLEFHHPVTNKKIKFHSKPPNDFKKFVERFRGEATGLRLGGRGKKPAKRSR